MTCSLTIIDKMSTPLTPFFNPSHKSVCRDRCRMIDPERSTRKGPQVRRGGFVGSPDGTYTVCEGAVWVE